MLEEYPEMRKEMLKSQCVSTIRPPNMQQHVAPLIQWPQPTGGIHMTQITTRYNKYKIMKQWFNKRYMFTSLQYIKYRPIYMTYCDLMPQNTVKKVKASPFSLIFYFFRSAWIGFKLLFFPNQQPNPLKTLHLLSWINEKQQIFSF